MPLVCVILRVVLILELRVFVGAILSARYFLHAVVGAQLSCAFMSMNRKNEPRECSFWQYNVYADIRWGSVERGRQMRVW